MFGFAEGVGDELVDHAIEDEAFFGEAPGGVAPGGCGGGNETGREVSEIEFVAGGEDDGAFDLVGEFADVAGPGLGEEAGFAVRRDREIFEAVARGDLGEEVTGEVKDVGAAFAERREREAEEVEAVVEVFAEGVLLDEVGERAVGGGDEADVDWDFARAAEAADGGVFDGGEEFRLRAGGEGADFVEEKRAAVGGFEEADAAAFGVGEGAAFVAEEFGFGEGVGERGAVDGDERTVGARAGTVEPAGEGGFAGAGFAFEKNGREAVFEASVGGDDGIELRAERAEGFAEEEGGGDGGGLGGAVFLAAGGAAGGAAAGEGEGELGGFEGFREVVAGAVAHGFDGFLYAAERGHDDDGGVFGEGVFAEKIEDLAIGQVEIDDGEIEAQVGEEAAGFAEARSFGDLSALVAKVGGETFAERGVVFEQEDLAAGGERGSGVGHAGGVRGEGERITNRK